MCYNSCFLTAWQLTKVFIGASLSEPHTSVTALSMCVYLAVNSNLLKVFIVINSEK